MNLCFYFCFGTDAYTTADVDYRWKGGDDQGIEIVSAEMAQFDLLGIKTRTKSQTNSKGETKSGTSLPFKKKKMVRYEKI